MMLLITGMIIAVTSDPFVPGLFYSMLGGAIIIIFYGALKNRKKTKRIKTPTTKV